MNPFFVIIPVLVAAILALVFFFREKLKIKQYPKYPGQDDAVALIMQHFEIGDKPIPSIEWVTGDRLNAPDKMGWRSDGGYVGGLTYGPTFIQVAMPEGHRFSGTGLVHEIGGHIAQYYHGSPFGLDPGHQGDVFKNGGAAIEVMNQILAARGQ